MERGLISLLRQISALREFESPRSYQFYIGCHMEPRIEVKVAGFLLGTAREQDVLDPCVMQYSGFTPDSAFAGFDLFDDADTVSIDFEEGTVTSFGEDGEELGETTLKDMLGL